MVRADDVEWDANLILEKLQEWASDTTAKHGSAELPGLRILLDGGVEGGREV